ncbi:Signal peptide peptidase SppA, 36K type [Candidatus Filomicrobium marinum]|uniref:Signal peptide peptidase SppA, 36K type n=2 Tax=Filomicrobium TaxID=119044 RepID=A0A0D6JEZ4_9HYPH|nr:MULTISPECIES: signal peptide peptidase SppA [Filomicrobium]MCV0367871.1 signal peptide peptidase SppA [Filomicrobium sp.]CFX19262.1 Signal peptide peptidase SppA, 36K type [Candidatus Filomicrobium marinum]CPR18492.1 Signal peptide peptidase SppA, 36K type [Candidatus Filomicrobium marinum]SDO18206.1 protease-4 [Filomicrobium insigne]
MSVETEVVLDRRRLRRKMASWRILAVLALLLAVGALLMSDKSLSGFLNKPQIARVSIVGTILEDRRQLQLLREIAKADHVAGVLLFVNSPGGTTTGGEALYTALRDVAEKKPVVAQFGTVAASAGYIVGLATDHIVSRGNTITGSVGVLMQWPEVTELLGKIGVKMNEVKSGALKAEPSPFKVADQEALNVTAEMIDDGFKWFLSLVEARRGITAAEVPGLKEGRIFSGRQAQDYKLVDEIGGEDEAVRWLKEKRGVPANVEVVDWKVKDDSGWGLSASLSNLAAGLVGAGVAGLTQFASRDGNLSSLSLDGLVSVWQPAKN